MEKLTMGRWRPHTTGILIGGFVVVLIALVVAYMVSNFQPTTQVSLGSGVFKARLATDDFTREQGLSGVEKLANNEGLLMVFDKADTHGIWMKDMKIAIDVIWLDSNKKVIYIVTNASPELGESKTFKPKSPASYILEIPAGTVQKSAIKMGDTAKFTLDKE